jgi:hypothetical protein
MSLTSLDTLHPLREVLLLLLPRLELLHLDLFSVFLEISLFLGCFRLLDPLTDEAISLRCQVRNLKRNVRFLHELGSNSLHMLIGFNHLSIVIVRSGKRDIVFSA